MPAAAWTSGPGTGTWAVYLAVYLKETPGCATIGSMGWLSRLCVAVLAAGAAVAGH